MRRVTIFFNRKNYHWINTFGLSVGITCVLAILLWVEDEMKFDSFNKNADRIYRVLNEEIGIMEGYTNSAMTMPPLAEALEEKLPEVEKAANFESDWDVVVKVGDNYLKEEGMAVVGRNFLDLFSFPVVAGNPGLLDSEKYVVVLSEKTAKKYFGEKEALGKQIGINKIPVTVVAILKNMDYNSHIRFDLAIPEALGMTMFNREKGNWDAQCLYTYIQTAPHVSREDLAPKLYDFVSKNIDPERKIRLIPQPLKEIHFQKNLADEDYTNLGDKRYVYIFSFMGLFILILACVNFINLSTAVSEKDIKTNGVRKILGASQAALIKTSVLKSLLTSAFAAGIALAMLYLLLPFINAFSLKSLDFDLSNPLHLLSVISVILFSGSLSGFYPAFYLSSFSPVKMLKGSKTGSGQWQRKGLIIFQFSLSVFLIIATLVSFKQFNYIRQVNLGFDKEHTGYFYLKTQQSDYLSLKERLLKIPGVEMVAGKDYYSPTIINTTPVKWQGNEDGEIFSQNLVDEDFFPLLKVKMSAGRNFSGDLKSEQDHEVIINQKAKELIGVADPVGMTLNFWGRQFRVGGIIGETYFRSVNESVQPEFYAYTDAPRYVFVRYNHAVSSVNQLMRRIGTTVKEQYPEAPFDFKFLDATYARLYENDKRIGTILGVVAVIAILISCMGLFGLSAYSSERRTKEIGVRKVNGAKVSEVLAMLNQDFIKSVAIAFVIACPVAYYAMHKWLENFAYKTELSWWIFALAGLLALGIALLTVSWQSWKAATRNPVEALRYD